MKSASAPIASPRDSSRFDQSAEELIRHAKEHPPEPIVQGLLNVGETLVIHGTEESFKSVFVLQIAESVNTGGLLLRRWEVHSHYRVGVLDTEMHSAGLGERLEKMFAPGAPPDGLFFFGEDALAHWRTLRFVDKFAMLEDWISRRDIEVLIVDTANDFFRGHDNPSDERIVGDFFDRMRNLPLKARILVRHDRKKKEHDFGAHSNELIRGSARWKEDPEAILYLKRKDKRTAGEVLLDQRITGCCVDRLSWHALPDKCFSCPFHLPVSEFSGIGAYQFKYHIIEWRLNAWPHAEQPRSTQQSRNSNGGQEPGSNKAGSRSI